MESHLQTLLHHGYSLLFCWVLAEQCGLPIPAIPVLLAAGALSATGEFNLFVSGLLIVTASLIGDLGWYVLGRKRGMKVLNLLCKLSLEPDSCVRQTEAAFSKAGMRSLLIAKFIPGLSTAAPPLAGVFGVSPLRFLVFDLLGTVLWAGSFLAVGWLFSHQVEMVTEKLIQLGGSLVRAAAILMGIYLGYKFIKRELFLRKLRVLRLQPEELLRMIERGEPHVIVDLRNPYDFENDPTVIAGALRMSPEELEAKHGEIPRDRDVVLYCT